MELENHSILQAQLVSRPSLDPGFGTVQLALFDLEGVPIDVGGGGGLSLPPLALNNEWLDGGTDLAYHQGPPLDLITRTFVPFDTHSADVDGLTTVLSGTSSTITADRDLLVQYTIYVHVSTPPDFPIGFHLRSDFDSDALADYCWIPAGCPSSGTILQSMGFLRAGEAITGLLFESNDAETSQLVSAWLILTPVLG